MSYLRSPSRLLAVMFQILQEQAMSRGLGRGEPRQVGRSKEMSPMIHQHRSDMRILAALRHFDLLDGALCGVPRSNTALSLEHGTSDHSAGRVHVFAAKYSRGSRVDCCHISSYLSEEIRGGDDTCIASPLLGNYLLHWLGLISRSLVYAGKCEKVRSVICTCICASGTLAAR